MTHTRCFWGRRQGPGAGSHEGGPRSKRGQRRGARVAGLGTGGARGGRGPGCGAPGGPAGQGVGAADSGNRQGDRLLPGGAGGGGWGDRTDTQLFCQGRRQAAGLALVMHGTKSAGGGVGPSPVCSVPPSGESKETDLWAGLGRAVGRGQADVRARGLGGERRPTHTGAGVPASLSGRPGGAA